MRADGIASAEVAGPGFINLRLEASAQAVVVNNVIDAGARYGHSDALGGQHINLEFVSANPTGPIHIGGTRWARSATRWAGCCPPRAPRWCANTISTTTAPKSTASPAH